MIQDLDWNVYQPLVITAALTGVVPTKEKYPMLPTAPAEIAADAVACGEAGASIVHIHMRDSAGKPSQSADLFAETIGLIRQQSPELIICATTTSRGSSRVSDRTAALELDEELLPDLASLTLGSYNTPSGVNSNPPAEILEILAAMRARGVVPEIEIFELGMIDTLNRLRKESLVPHTAPVNIFLGVQGALAATAQNLISAVTALPDGAIWSGAGIGRFQKSVIALSIAIGGGVRVGLEDDPRGENPDWTNVDAVERACALAKSLGRSIATPSATRQILGLGR